MTRCSNLTLGLLLASVLLACNGQPMAPPEGEDPPKEAMTDQWGRPTATPGVYDSVVPSNDPALVIGTYPLKKDGVVDGDTFKVEGVKGSLRLLSLDTEEVMYPQHPAARHAALMRSDFAAYVREMTKGQALPVKFPTPMGDAATRFARKLVPAGTTLQLERDRAGSGADRYGRLLCHAWIITPGAPPRLYALEAIRAGMSPYFVKYGISQRFDAAFRAAQTEAIVAKLGIWDPGAEHYPDYSRRLEWWERRAGALARLEKRLGGAPGPSAPIDLSSPDAIRVLSKRVGDPVRVVGVVDDHDRKAVVLHDRGATIRIGGRRYIEVEVIGRELVRRIQPKLLHGEILQVVGQLDRKGSVLRGTLRYMRITVTAESQITPGHLME